MTEVESSTQEAGKDAPSAEDQNARAMLRLETRLARAEAQIQGLQESMADVHAYFRVAKQRALYLRIGLLVAALAAFFYLRYVMSPG